MMPRTPAPETPGEIRALHARRQHLLARLALPSEGLPGSLALSHRRCGSPTCHCHADAQGHPSWTLTFMVAGTKRVMHVPQDDVDAVRHRVEAGNQFKADVAEVLAINAQLMVLERQAHARRGRATPRARR